MSLTCTHTDPFFHPECAGCRALATRQAADAEREQRSRAAERFGTWSSPPTPIEDVTRAVRDNAGYARQFNQRPAPFDVNPADLVTVDIVATPAGGTFAPPAPLPLLDRDPTPEDREAERDQPRPGVWAGERGADLRALTQDETDALIRFELADFALRGGAVEYREVLGAIGASEDRPARPVDWGGVPREIARCQRGGIDSDPLVRVLARRAWGDRDREWFELRGVRKGDRLTPMYRFVNAAWPGEAVLVGEAESDARPGEMVRAKFRSNVESYPSRVGDRLREQPEFDSAQRPIRSNHASIGPVNPTAPERVMRRADLARVWEPVGTRGGEANGVYRWQAADGMPWIDDVRGARAAGAVMADAAAVLDRVWPDYRVLSVDADTFRLALEQDRLAPIAKAKADGDAPAFRPGERRPGYKPAPPTPRWARKRRRDRSQPRGGR